ncbi:MAG TPA: hypothetical protein QKA08_03560 [Candidatus Megaira endosymbiont of Nemacystus decipiens]|nr:hypothetical protein [Candidatus Megaera endosymbiont of Nemacystus decipiens]
MKTKALILSIVLYISLWCLSAHCIKKNTVQFVNELNTDNIKFSYDQISVSGFPFFWIVNIDTPKVTSISHNGLHEAIFNKIKIKYTIYTLELSIDNEILFSNSENSQDLESYSLICEGINVLKLKFDKPIWFSSFDNFMQDIISIELAFSPVSAVGNEKEIFNISHLNFDVLKIEEELFNHFAIKFSTHYVLEGPRLSNQILLDINYMAPKKKLIQIVTEDLDYEHKFILNKFNFCHAEEDAEVDFKGVLNLKTGEDPAGKFKVMFKNYDKLIQSSVPDDFFLPKEFLQNFIEESAIASGQKIDNNYIEFDIFISDQNFDIKRRNI